MSSDSKKPRKPRFRFDFSGESKPAKNAVSTRDDILNSLTRQAHPEVLPDRNVRVLEILPADDASQSQSQFQGTEPVPLLPERTGKNRGFLRGAFVIFLGGFLAVWLYGYLTRAYEIPYLQEIIQNPNVQVAVQLVLANPIPSVAISALVLLAVIYGIHRRKS